MSVTHIERVWKSDQPVAYSVLTKFEKVTLIPVHGKKRRHEHLTVHAGRPVTQLVLLNSVQVPEVGSDLASSNLGARHPNRCP